MTKLKRKQSLTSKVLLLARVKESLRQIAVEKDTLMNNKSSLNLTQVLKDFQDPLYQAGAMRKSWEARVKR